MQYANKSLTRYLNDLSAKLPAPGGGSSAALAASMACALLSMVINFTLGKARYAAFEKELKAILIKTERFKKRFLILLDADVAAYASKNKAKSLAVPLETAVLISQASLLCRPLAKKGNENLISDVAVAAALLEAALASAAFNVEINLKGAKDKKSAQKIRRQLAAISKIVKKVRKDTEESFGKVIRG